jgi:hypothetical protein
MKSPTRSPAQARVNQTARDPSRRCISATAPPGHTERRRRRSRRRQR